MSEAPQKSYLSRLLDQLQHESWQLELLISGFAIFLLVGAYEPLSDLELIIEQFTHAQTGFELLGFLYGVLTASWLVLLINLLIHVLIRGLWISTIGLRSVSEDIDFDSLRLTERFDRFLRKRIGSFDHYIERLEKVSSVIFAFTFLLIFMLCSMGLFFLGFGFLDWLSEDLFPDRLGIDWLNPFFVILAIAYVLFGLIYFLDFLTLSRWKRVKWFSAVYFPVYRFYGWLTLANLYRPLYYNLIDNKFGRRIGWLLVPYLLVIALVASVRFGGYPYLPPEGQGRQLRTAYYEDQWTGDRVIKTPTLPSRFVSNGYLEAFLPYNPRLHDQVLQRLCPDLQPAGSKGVHFDGPISININDRNAMDFDQLSDCFEGFFRLTIDTVEVTHKGLRFINAPTARKYGTIATLDVDTLIRGEHLLRIEERRIARRADSLVWLTTAVIPFWKE